MVDILDDICIEKEISQIIPNQTLMVNTGWEKS